MKLEAMKRQGKREDLKEGSTSTQNGWKSETAELIGKQVGESKNQVRRYIRLTELIPDLLDMVDRKRLNFTKNIRKYLLAALFNAPTTMDDITELRCSMS